MPGKKAKLKPSEAAEIPQPGAMASCNRCGVQLRVSESRREDSAPFRRSLTTKGVCPDCVMTQFLYNTYPINWQLDERGPELLLHPMIREAFLSSGVMERCEMSIDEVNWERVVANWNLPVKVTNDGTNPYKMGDAKRHGPSKTFGPQGFGAMQQVFEDRLNDFVGSDLDRFRRSAFQLWRRHLAAGQEADPRLGNAEIGRHLALAQAALSLLAVKPGTKLHRRHLSFPLQIFIKTLGI